MSEIREHARIHDVLLARGAEAYEVEPLDGGGGAAVLWLHWFDTDAPDAPDGNPAAVPRRGGGAGGHARRRVDPAPGRLSVVTDPSAAEPDVAAIRAEVARHRSAVDRLAARSDVDGKRRSLRLA